MRSGILPTSVGITVFLCCGLSCAAGATAGERIMLLYDVSEVATTADPPQIEFTLRLINPGETDLERVEVLVADTILVKAVHATWRDLTVPAAAVVDLSGSFAVPRREFDLWANGSPPRFLVTARSEGGRLHRLEVEARRVPLPSDGGGYAAQRPETSDDRDGRVRIETAARGTVELP